MLRDQTGEYSRVEGTMNGSSTGVPRKLVAVGCALAALMITCGVGALLVSVAFGVGLMSAMDAPAHAAEGLLEDVRAQRIDSAYERMSPSYRAMHTSAEFAAHVGSIPAMATMTGATIRRREVTGTTARMGGTLDTPSGEVVVDVYLSGSADRWVVERIDVSGATIP